MVRAFSRKTGPDGADFSAMTKTTNPDEQLYVQAVLHRAYVAVDEKGTEAAGALQLAAEALGIPRTIPFTPYFNADRPFVYLIRDVRTGVILFLGRVAKP